MCQRLRCHFLFLVQTRSTLASLPEEQLGRSMVSQRLTPDPWSTLDQINVALTQEYAVRREMLLTRADVTVQSLSWADKAKVQGAWLLGGVVMGNECRV